MKKLYKEYFYIPEQGKIREKVLLARVTVAVVVIIACLFAMGMTAYAYFTVEAVVANGSNIASAEYELNTQVTCEGVFVTVTDHSFVAEAGKTYTVSLQYAEGSAGTGFGVITATNCADTYHTQQIGRDVTAEEGFRAQVIFELSVTEDTTVFVVSHWGTSSHYSAYAEKGEGDKLYITNENVGGKGVLMTVNNAVEKVGESDDESETAPADLQKTDPVEIIHTVVEGENLTKIANQYDTTVARIVAYNGISDPDNILVGQQIKIPSADWVIPEDT